MKRVFLLAVPALVVLTLVGCANGYSSHRADSAASMPMAMMGDKEMMDMCMAHMSQMTPEMRQKHMDMMQRHHQMMDQKKMKPQQPSYSSRFGVPKTGLAHPSAV
jgi:hypothetical protein